MESVQRNVGESSVRIMSFQLLHWLILLVNYHYRDIVRGNQCHYEISIVDKLSSAPKVFFSYVRKWKKCCSLVGPLKSRLREIVSGATEMNELLVDAFSIVFIE